ncbi:spore germination protein [Bacillus sp. FJAT-45350]|uniref:spore germination protein n=1 Tax=Bacillus sp. FJAT-45350 TaxID=2011014 RepID=UPI0011550781|nr:spore germination protein [Bacillus sp. FJAT-45350]
MLRRLMKKRKAQTSTFTKHDYNDFLRYKIGITELNILPNSVEELKVILERVFDNSDDFSVRSMELPSGQKVFFYYVAGLIDADRMEEAVIRPIVNHGEKNPHEKLTHVGSLNYEVNYITVDSWPDLIQLCLQGHVICQISDQKPVVLSLEKLEKRSLSEPTTEQQVYGPKIGFIEDSRTNVGLVRRIIVDPRLKVKQFHVGSLTHTAVAVMYLEEYVDNEVLEEVLKKIPQYENDFLISSYALERSLIEHPNSLFPQFQKSERPDQVAYALSQGKIVIAINNSTFSLILPATMWSFYERSDDNDEGSPWHVFFIRMLRISSLIIATTFPALYVALVAFHPEMVPTTLALTMAESRNNIPFPAAIEAFIMMFALDVLVEASIRLPSFIGPTIGIVGGLVIGQSAVEAGIISSTMVIVIAFTAIAAFTSPSWELASSWRVIRYLFLLAASLLGMYGLTLAICVLAMHLCALTSMNKPFLSPMAPFNFREFINMIVRIKKKNSGVGEGRK